MWKRMVQVSEDALTSSGGPRTPAGTSRSSGLTTGMSDATSERTSSAPEYPTSDAALAAPDVEPAVRAPSNRPSGRAPARDDERETDPEDRKTAKADSGSFPTHAD